MSKSKRTAPNHRELFIRNLLYVALLSVAPAFIFLGQAVLFAPPLGIFSSATYILWLLLTDAAQELSLYTILLLAHFAVFATFYWLVAFGLTKLITFFHVRSTQILLTLTLLMPLVAVTQMPLYGAGGHGASKLGPIQSLLQSNPNNVDSKPDVYFLVVILFVTAAGLLHWYRRRG